MLSRYLFVFYAIYFLAHVLMYTLEDLKGENKNKNMLISKQRVAIIFMHLTAFLILTYIPGTYRFKMSGLIFAFGTLLLYSFFYVCINKIYKNSCKSMWNCVFFMLDIGLIMIYRLNPQLAMRQLLWFTIGFGAALVIPLFFKFLYVIEKLGVVYFTLALILVVSPFFLGQEQHGAIRQIAIRGRNFQPSEIVKFLYVLFLASTFRKGFTIKRMLISSLSAIFVISLVVQTDLGASLIFSITYIVVIYIISGSKFLLLSGVTVAIISSIVGYRLFAHVRIRVDIWLNPWNYPSGAGFQLIQSLFAIGTFGLFGSGLGRGYPHTIPVVVSDFIFSAIVEEFGVIFGVALIGVFMMLILKCILISLQCKDFFTTIIVVGFTSMLSTQTFLILGGVTRLIPLTGVTMPFVSYGGSSIVVSVIMIGIIQACNINNKKQNIIDAGTEGYV
jgi:cell division protein FtsW (lipid II flippase)